MLCGPFHAIFPGMPVKKRLPLRYILVAVWGAFTVTLTGWWIYFGLRQIEKLRALDPSEGQDMARHQRMLFWEGGVLVLMLFLGAAAIAYYMYRELKEARRMREFFSVFTHEIKTPLSSLLLGAELLAEKISNQSEKEIALRLLSDIERLSLQVDNSLFLAQRDGSKILTEELRLSDIVHSIQHHIPTLAVAMIGDSKVRADRRAIQSIFLNLASNARLHGRANKLSISVDQQEPGIVKIGFKDDGQGFQGDREGLGKLFFRPYSGSGSGIGLHLSAALCKLMRGSLSFPETGSGFCVQISLPGEVV